MITVKQFTFNPFGENTYLLFDETNEAVIIDCGCTGINEEATLQRTISENKLTLKRLLTTHYHFDHIAGNAFIYHTYGIKPEIPEGESNAPKLKQQASLFGIQTQFEEIEPEKFINENDNIKFGNSALTTLNVAGHSPASLAFYSKENNIIFTGDAIFQNSIGRTDLWGGDYDTLISNLKKNVLTLPDNTIIYPGHGPATTVKIEKHTNPYLN